jgi:hypothetical protein
MTPREKDDTSPARIRAAVGVAVFLAVLLTVFLVLGGGAMLRGARRFPDLGGSAVAATSGTCGRGFKSCGGGCVSADEPAHGCGADTCDACAVDNAIARCDALAHCAVDVCYQDFRDCDGDRATGCETNLLTDPDHCGSCDTVCPPLAHAERGCGGRCTIWRCERGFRDCDAQAGDGCEIDVMTDPSNCGRCHHRCGADQRCEHGQCG